MPEFVARVGAAWEGEPYTPRDFENVLCIYQEVLTRATRRRRSSRADA